MVHAVANRRRVYVAEMQTLPKITTKSLCLSESMVSAAVPMSDVDFFVQSHRTKHRASFFTRGRIDTVAIAVNYRKTTKLLVKNPNRRRLIRL